MRRAVTTPVVRRVGVAVAGGVALGIGAATAAAQSVRGVVVDPGGVPVPGVVVQAIDTAGAVTGRALTDQKGAFLLFAGKPGVYVVKTLRIGFRPVVSAPIALAAGEERSQRFELAGIPVTLSSVRIDGDAVCGRRASDSTTAAFAAWDQVRTAFAATQLTTGAQGLTVTTITFERALSPNERVVLHDDYAIRTERVRSAWRETPPAVLHARGYVAEDSLNGVTYDVPGLEMLGSNTFLEDHCLRVARGSDSLRLGIAFEPVADRRDVPEVSGTAWLDRKTSELRTIEYRYVNLPEERREANSGGAIEFARLTSGEWAIARWTLRMPVLEQVAREARLGGVEIRLGEVRVVGAEMTVAMRGADTLWARPGMPMSGVVTDSLSGKPVAGALVALRGDRRTAFTDARGRYTLPGVIPGDYMLEVHTASLDSVKSVHQMPVAFVDTSVSADVKVLNATIIRRAMAARNAGAFAGTVTDSLDHPIPGVEVALADLSRSATTAADGSFRIADVPAGVHQVLARRVGLGAYQGPVSVSPGHVVQRRIVLSKITELAAVNVTAEAGTANLPQSFEDHRRTGLGTFYTRDSIALMEGAPLSTLLGRTPALGMINSRGHAAWVMGSRIPPSLGGANIYQPEDFEKSMGMKAGCYAQVYLDRTLLNPGSPTQPFDINSIPPTQVEAIEWFPSASSVPLEYNGLNSACGVLVLHSRR
ncbi:MAG TPA: carboxypeptidase-like regulatory domain-containing protein [Gemmatimonadaceae bacterium]|nr:carboxypeptidase-like regulatory domain-containing protein [Gemmatimonadaceae bacterium]